MQKVQRLKPSRFLKCKYIKYNRYNTNSYVLFKMAKLSPFRPRSIQASNALAMKYFNKKAYRIVCFTDTDKNAWATVLLLCGIKHKQQQINKNPVCVK